MDVEPFTTSGNAIGDERYCGKGGKTNRVRTVAMVFPAGTDARQLNLGT